MHSLYIVLSTVMILCIESFKHGCIKNDQLISILINFQEMELDYSNLLL